MVHLSFNHEERHPVPLLFVVNHIDSPCVRLTGDSLWYSFPVPSIRNWPETLTTQDTVVASRSQLDGVPIPVLPCLT